MLTKLNVIYNRIPHHASHSGYDQIVRHLADRVPLNRLNDRFGSMLPDHTWWRLAESSSRWITGWSGMDWYDTYSFSLEATALWKILWGKQQIFHVLYGEDSYRFLGCLGALGRWKGTRIVCSYHQPPEVFERVVRRKDVLRRLDAIIVVASNQAEYFQSIIGKDKVFVVHHGVDTDFFTPAKRNDGEGKVCLFVGQWLRDFKLLRAVVQAMGRIDPTVTFKLITREDQAEAFAGFDNVVALCGISDEKLLKLYKPADILLMPLTDCTANCALLEGMACGLPMVATDVGGIGDYVDDTCARLVPPGDIEGMCHTITSVLADDEQRKALGSASRQRALKFDWSHMTDRLVSVYETIVK